MPPPPLALSGCPELSACGLLLTEDTVTTLRTFETCLIDSSVGVSLGVGDGDVCCVVLDSQRPPLDGSKTVFLCGDKATFNDLAAPLLPFFATNARSVCFAGLLSLTYRCVFPLACLRMLYPHPEMQACALTYQLFLASLMTVTVGSQRAYARTCKT